MIHYIVGVGASAGGLDPLKQFFSKVRRNGNTAFVVISHLPIDYPTHLHELLSIEHHAPSSETT